MKRSIENVFVRRTEEESLRSSYRRLSVSRLHVNVYSVREDMQRQGAALLHGLEDAPGSWEELDCRQLADDKHGERTSYVLGGTVGVAVLDNLGKNGLLGLAGTGTLFISHFEMLSRPGQHALCQIVKSGHYTPIGDPYPRRIACRIIVATSQSIEEMARSFRISGEVEEVLGNIAIPAERIVDAFLAKANFNTHPSLVAAVG
jgi:transcriptional regulator of acetoin/glycerol metabolism